MSPVTRRRTPVAVLAALAGPLLLTACGSGVEAAAPPTAGAADTTVSITNCGRDLSFDTAPARVVGLMPTQTELLLRLGVEDLLVGQAQTAVSALPADLADLAADVPVLSADTPPAREDLLAAEPDLVVSPTEYEFTATQGFASIEQLAENGVSAYVATGGCAERRNSAQVTDTFTDIDNLGAILQVPEAATDLVQDGQERLAAVATAIDGREQPTVAQVYLEGTTLTAIGAGVEADIIATAGGAGVFDPASPEFADFFAAQINPEEIASRAPAAIVFGVTGPEHEQQTRDYLQATFPDVPAVRDGLLVAVPSSDLHPGTLGNIGAVETIARRLHPDAF